MNKENIDTLISSHISLNYINNNVNVKNIKKGFMFIIPGPDANLGKWKKESNFWIWVYNDKNINYTYKYSGIEPKYLKNKKWAFAGLHPELSFCTIEFDTKIIFFDKNNIQTNYIFDYLIPDTIFDDLKNYIITLKVTEANTYFKNFNFNPDQIKVILGFLKIKSKNDDKTFNSTLTTGSWLYIGKSPKTSIPIWFFVVESKDYYIEGYNYVEGDEPIFNKETNSWSSNSEITKDFKTNSLPDFIKTTLIEKQIIEGSSYDNVKNSSEEKDIELTKRESLYDRAIKGEFKNITQTNKQEKFLEKDEFAGEKEIEYKNIKIMQTNKTFQLSYEGVESELKRISAKNLFDNSVFIKSNEILDEENKITQAYNPLEFLKDFKTNFEDKNKNIYFCLIELVDETIKTIFANEFINTQNIKFDKLMLILKSSKKTAYFKLDNKNFIMEKIINSQYILIQKDEAYSISEKFKCRKMIEEMQAGYRLK